MTSKQPNLLLRAARLKSHWGQNDVATLIGVATLSVGRWERGECSPSHYYQAKLTQLFGMSSIQLGFSPPIEENTPRDKTRHPPLIDSMIPLSSQLLIGRDDILEFIRQRLSTNKTAIALYGLPGVGKTSLALSITTDPTIHAHFPDGILWAGLGPKPVVSEILSRWGALLGIAGNGIGASKNRQTWATILRETIGARRFLIVLDDIWDYSDALLLKVGGPHCTYIATTRSPNIAISFAMQEAISIPELSEENGIVLLNHLVPEITTYDREQVRTLVRSVGALPLALTLAGRYLQTQGYSGQKRRLRQAIEHLLTTEHRLHLSEPRSPSDPYLSLSSGTSLSLQAVIEVSDQHLNEQAHQTLCALSIFPSKPNTFSEEAALAVSTASIQILDQLSDGGLLEITAKGRYTLHQTIADYARSKYSSEESDKHFVVYYINYMKRHITDYEEIEVNNMLAMLDIAYEKGMKKYLMQATCAFVPFLLLRGLYDLAEYHLHHAYHEARGESESEVPLLLLLGQTAQKRGNYPQAVEYFQEGLLLARQQQNLEWISALLADLGWVTWKQGDYIQAEKDLREGLLLARHVGSNERICKILRVLGAVLSSLGKYSDGQEHLCEGLDLARQIGNLEQICVLLIDLGVSFQEKEDFILAEKHLLEGLALACQIGHREWMSLAYLNLADMALSLYQYHDAEEYAHKGLILARQISSHEWMCGHLCNLGISACKQGDFLEAQKYFLEAVSLAEHVGRPYMIFITMYEYACLTLEQKNVQATETLLRESHMIIPQGDQELIGLWTFGMARLAALHGNISEAFYLGRESISIFGAIQSQRNKNQVEQWLNELL